jgi:hypothetical protein
MPSKDPLPVLGTDEHAAPNGWSAAIDGDIDGDSEGIEDSDGIIDGALDVGAPAGAAVWGALHAATLRGRMSAAPIAANLARVDVMIMVVGLLGRS